MLAGRASFGFAGLLWISISLIIIKLSLNHEYTRVLKQYHSQAVEMSEKLVEQDECYCASPLSAVQSTASGGWIYDKGLIARQHVKFDAGLGNEIIRIVKTYTPNRGSEERVSIGDIGAGVGQFGAWLLEQDEVLLDWYAFDGGNNVNEFCKKNVALIDQNPYKVPKVCYIDASIPIKLKDLDEDGAPWDWVMSIEVAEHIPAESQDIYIDNLIRLSKYGLIISWAVPGQGGHQHVNERPNQEIVQMMEGKGLSYLAQESETIRTRINRLSWLKNTVMVFTKPAGEEGF